MSLSIVIAGGGTGGHVFPGLALAEALTGLDPDVRVAFIGTARGMEKTLIPKAGFDLDLIDVLPYAKTIGPKRFLAPASALRATLDARGILKRRRANVVASMGGYASMPAALAARSLGIPLVVHEQNAIPGRANLIASRLTRSIAVSVPMSVDRFAHPESVRVVGNPVRKSIAYLNRTSLRGEACEFFGFDPLRKTLLISGGSQGAKRLNDAASYIAELWSLRSDVQLLLLAGAGNATTMRGPSKALEFTDRMDLAYAAADVIIARSGANVFEILCAGLPSILVPYPFARDDHQRLNANWLEQAGAAMIVRNEDATGELLKRSAEMLLVDSSRCDQMSSAALALAKPDAARDLARIVLSNAGDSR
ncbi:MAG: undecaprenyldiphospho-muramoylpentapeptide beta-N-acetylglucosaminyltransferase [Actinomycetota bacterium]